MTFFDSIAVAADEAARVVRSAEQDDAHAPIAVGWNNGLFLESADRSFRLRVGLLVHADGRFALGDERDAVANTFAVRRGRLILQGRVADRFEFNLTPDFSGAGLQDAFIETRFSNAFRVKVGRIKAPFGLERQQSASHFLFFERALPTTLVPNRSAGVQVLGDLADRSVSYAVGVSNGSVDGGTSDLDDDDGKEIAGRVVVRPAVRSSGSPLSGLGVAVAATRGGQNALPVIRTALLQQVFFSYAGAVGDGDRVKYSPQVFYYHGSFGGFGEYVHSTQPIRRGGVAADVTHRAWQMAVSWVLTGEQATEQGVRPARNFGFGAGGMGAVQIAARYHAFSVDERAITLGLAASESSRTADAFTVGVNWYLNPYFKYVLNFERTVFDGGEPGARPTEHAVVFRTHLGF